MPPLFCKQRTGYAINTISIFFTLDPNTPNVQSSNQFFDFQDQAVGSQQFDLSKVLNAGTLMHGYVHSYVGTSSQPPCSKQCWTVLETPYLITQTQLDYFKVNGLDMNIRQGDLGKYSKQITYKGFFAQ